MDHKSMEMKVFSLYDGELPAAERPEVEAHLIACMDCRRSLESWKKTSQAFFQGRSLGPSEAFVEKIMARLEKPERAWTGDRRRWLVPAFGLAAVIGLLLGGPSRFETLPTPDNLLLVEEEQTPFQWIVAEDEPDTDEILGINLEEI